MSVAQVISVSCLAELSLLQKTQTIQSLVVICCGDSLETIVLVENEASIFRQWTDLGENSHRYTHAHTHTYTHTHKLVKWPPTISGLCHARGELSKREHSREALTEIGCRHSSPLLLP